MTTRTVSVTRSTQDFSYFNKKNERQPLGTVAVDVYGDENLQKLKFYPDSDNDFAAPSKKEDGYEVGIGSDSLTFVNPADIQEVILDQGWQIKDQYATSSGLEMMSVYIRPDLEISDPYSHDLSFWQNPTRAIRPGTHERTSIMFPALQLETSLYVGRMAARVSMGIYRSVCTNGLISRMLDLPGIDFRHNTWDIEEMNEFMTGTGSSITGLPETKRIGRIEGLRKSIALLKQYSEASQSGESMARFEAMKTMFRSLSPSVLSPWVLDGYIEHLELIAGSRSADDPVTTMDLLMGYTSSVNSHRDLTGSDRGVWSALYVTDRVLNTTSNFIQMADLFS